MPADFAQSQTVRDQVRQGYTQIAAAGGLAVVAGGCCGGNSDCDNQQLAQAIGYQSDDLQSLPDGANMGLSCGNPMALASLCAGEVVLDLGSGGGFDVFLAGPRVGATGRVIGIDMTADMLAKARRNIAFYRDRTGLDNVEFRLGEIEYLPVADASVDCVISNCVLNLSPEKSQVWHEIARVLRPGGRVAISDVHLLRELPSALQHEMAALIGCVAGAVSVEETRRMATDAELSDIEIIIKPEYISSLRRVAEALYDRLQSQLPTGDQLSDYVTSANITAVKL